MKNELTANYHRTKMQKESVLQLLREKGCRITKQRKILLDIILQEECASCKEIYYKAASVDSSIGIATVYRMVNPGDFRRAQTMWLYYGTKRYKRHSGTLREGMLILNPSGREQRQFPRI